MNKRFWLLIFSALIFSPACLPSEQSITAEIPIFEFKSGRVDGLENSFTTFYFYQSGHIDCQTSQNTSPTEKIVGKKEKS